MQGVRPQLRLKGHGLVFMVHGLGFRVYGLVFSVWGLGG